MERAGGMGRGKERGRRGDQLRGEGRRRKGIRKLGVRVEEEGRRKG